MTKILARILRCMTMGFSGGTVPIPETTDQDGGVKRYNSGTDAPKTVQSTELLRFECEASLISAVLEEESELDGRVYKLHAVCENETVQCKIKWYDRSGNGDTSEFTADTSFMAGLQEIVSTYDFAKYNGYSCEVSGLPDMYGARLDVRYESGESIYAYDNQDCFIPFEAMKELVALFTSAKVQ